MGSKNKKNTRPEKQAKNEHLIEIIAFTIFFAALFLLIMLIYPKETGLAYKHIGSFIYFIMGKAEFLLIILLFITSSHLFFNFKNLNYMFYSLFLIFTVNFCLLFELTEKNSGGIIGKKMAEILTPYVGYAGGFLLSVATTLILFTFITKISLKKPLLLVINFIFSSIKSIAGKLKDISLQKKIPKNPKIQTEKIRQKRKGTAILEPIIETEAPLVPVNEKTLTKYTLPPLSLLNDSTPAKKSQKSRDYSSLLLETLRSFGVEASVGNILIGPTVTRYELQPAKGVKVKSITNLANDIALSLAALSIRIEAPIPGKAAIGIEVPNQIIDPVTLKEILESPQFKNAGRFAMGLGKDITGQPIIGNMLSMPHLLIAGATGSGKSVCLNDIIVSFLYMCTPHELQIVMIDPKRVELIFYEGIPHLAKTAEIGTQIITDSKRATLILNQLTIEMDKRYEAFSQVRARNIAEYNKYCIDNSENPLPVLMLIIDELADLMMISAHTVETSICRLAQLGRACGIHLILATQRPTVNVITGLIKANIPSRIAFAVSSQVDSRTILDKAGAEKLLGKGDMLYLPLDMPEPKRSQGAYISTEEINKVVDFWAKQPPPEGRLNLTPTLSQDINKEDLLENTDELLKDAFNIILICKQASVSILQRKMKIGYARAGRIMDQLEKLGYVGPADGAKPRKILINENPFG